MGADADGTAFLIGDWLVEPELNRIVRGGEVVKIDPRNVRLLQLLVSRPRQVISQAEIERTVWSDVVVTPNSVYQSIAQLRRALGDEKANPRYIETIARKGYRLVAEISRIREKARSADPLLRDIERIPAQATDSKTRPARLPGRNLIRIRSAALTSRMVLSGALLLPIAIVLTTTQTPLNADGAGAIKHQSIADPLDGIFLATFKNPESPNVRSHVLTEMAVLALIDGRVREARKFAEEAVELEVHTSGPADADTGHALTVLTNVHHWIGNYEDAERTAREALIAFAPAPDAHLQKIEALAALGSVLADRGKFAEADALIKKAIVLNETVYGATSEYAAFSRSQLALLRHLEGRVIEAERLLRGVVASEDATRSDKVSEAKYHMQLASVLCTQGRHAEAVTEARRALGGISENMRKDHPYAASTQEVLGAGLLGLGQFDEAEAALRSAMSIWRNNGVWPWRAGRSASALGEVLLAQGRISEAEKYFAYASSALKNAPEGQMEQNALRDHQARLEKLSEVLSERQSQVNARSVKFSDV